MASSSSSPPIDTAHHHPLFLPFARFDPLHPEEELPLSVGRPVLVLNREESPDWWFGRDVEDGREVSSYAYLSVFSSIDRCIDRSVDWIVGPSTD